MDKNKIKIIIMILVCIFLCSCVICISIIIPKHLIEISNDEAIVKYGEYKYYVYGDTFYATIEKIETKNENTYIYVKGLEINDINHRGKYYFKVDDDTKLLFWRYEEIKLTDLKEGQTISITSTGTIIKSTGLILKVAEVNLLDDYLQE